MPIDLANIGLTLADEQVKTLINSFWGDIAEYLPKRLPQGWRQLGNDTLSPVSYAGPKGLKVMVSCMTELDGRGWKHVSFSHRDRLPTYEEMVKIKQIFIGSNADAIQLLPRASRHVNEHPYCLHLWSCITEPDLLPDFTRGLGII